MSAKRMVQVVYLVSLALVAAACTAIIRTPTPGPVVKLWGERGQVHLQHPDEQPITITETLVDQPELVHTGDEITIGDKSLGVLTVAEFLRVEAYSKAQLRVNTVPDPDGSPTVKLYLVSGTMLQELPRQVDQQVDVTIDTYWVTIRAVSTACLVSVDDHEGTWVVVFYGKAEVEAQGRTVVARTGQATWVEPYKEPQPPFDVSVTAVDAWANKARQGEEVGPVPQVIAASLAPTPTPTSTPTPTPTPTHTPTSTPTSTPTATPTLIPAKVHLISDLQISDPSPLVGERVRAAFKVRNYGEQAFRAAKFLVKGRGPDGSIQDFRPIDNFSLDAGAEGAYSEYRSFSSPGRHWFTPYYSSDGVNWDDIAWPDGRTSYVYINVVPDYPPQVTVSVEPATINRDAELVIQVTASDDIGLESIRWWSEGTGDESLDSGGKFVYDGGVRSFGKSWSQKWTGKTGKFTIHAQARDSASQLSSVVSAAITVLPGEKFSLSSGGEPFNDALVQVAMGLAINWSALREEIGEVVLVDFDSGETLAGPKEPEHNPNLARSLLAEVGHVRFDAVILYDSGDDPATELADAVANYLNAVNINAARRGVASANARTRFADMIAAGESGFLIERRK